MILIIVFYATAFCNAQVYTFDFDSNTESVSAGGSNRNIVQTVNGVTVTISSDNDILFSKITQVSYFEGVNGTSGSFLTTSWRNNTLHFEFSEPVFIGDIVATKLGTGILNQVYTNTSLGATDDPIAVDFLTAQHISLGWQNVTSFKIENNLPATVVPFWDSLTFIPMSEFSNSQTYVPDTTFEQHLIDQGLDDVLDDYVNTSNILFKNILSFSGVSDLTGIEDFLSLEYFFCRDCPDLTGVVDLTTNSNLILILINNSKITDIDLSTNTKLKYLQLIDNKLTDVEFPLGADLLSVDIENTNIESLDFSNYPNLTSLKLNNNSLISLNIANGNNNDLSTFRAAENPELSCIQVSNVAFANANFTDVDDGVIFTTDDCSSTLSLDQKTKEDSAIRIAFDAITKTVTLTGDIDSISVYNLSGSKIYEGNSLFISTLGWSQGIYILKVKSKNGKYSNTKILI
ncbi:MAG: T9SS type A sorting domain-containing protein [Algibacter sp.]